MMMKTWMSIRYSLWLSSLVICFPTMAKEMSEENCQITMQDPVIDYGQLSRAIITHDGIDKLPTRHQVVTIACHEDIELSTLIEGSQRGKEGFAYGKASLLSIMVNDVRVDGQSTSFRVLRNNSLRETSALLPGDKIQPYPLRQGRNLELVLDVTPRLQTPDVKGGQASTIQEMVTLRVPNANAQHFTVASTLSAAACTPSISQNVIDYGSIRQAELASQGPTILSAKTLNFTITCDGMTNVAIRAKSNRINTSADVQGGDNEVGSALPTSEVIAAGLGREQPLGLPDVTSPSVAGLGKSEDGNAIGGYMLNLPFTQVYLDGSVAKTKFWTSQYPTASITWNKNTSLQSQGDSLFSSSSGYFSYGTDTAATTPSPFTILTGTLIVQAYITAKQNLNFSQPIYLNGSSSIELFYF